MKISLNWLQDFIDLKEKDHENIKEVITANSAEVETMERQGDHLENVIVGKVVELKPHPNADRLQLAVVTDGEEKYKVVCGGSNLKEAMLVAYAKVGAVVKWHGSEIMKLEKVKLRGEESYGMICAGEEIGLAEIFPAKHEHEIVDLSHLDLKVGTPLAKALGLNDVVLDVDNHAITNRSDLFSHRGFAREFVANDLGKWKKGAVRAGFILPKQQTKTPPPIELTIKDKDVCPHYMGVYMTGVEVKESPDWMKKRLSACGIRPIANLVDITNYVMLELGMPLHAFDLEKIPGKKWVMRKSRKGEKVITLDEQKHELPNDVIILDDGHEIFDLCGIMGGFNSGINEKTEKIWLHSPVYSPTLIRQAMRALGHISDAAIIYEKNIDPELAADGLYRAMELILECCPNAKVASEVMDIRNAKPIERELDLQTKEINRLVGIEIPDKKVERILDDLGFKYKKIKEGYKVTVPSWRTNDVHREADLIEEVARIYGYDNIPEITPQTDITPIPVNRRRALEKQIRNELAGFGFDEVYNFAFLGPELLAKCLMEKDNQTVEIANPLSADQSLMRQNLLPRVLENIADNLRYHEKLRVFELNPTYFKTGRTKHEERSTLMIATAGEDFRILEGVLEAVGFTVMPTQKHSPQHHPGREADLIIRGQVVGQLAELHPQILKNFDIKERVIAAHVNLEAIHNMNLEHWPKYQELSKYPSVKLDVSILIPKKDLSLDYLKAIQNADKKLIKDIELIDEYTGDKVPKDHRALTYSITYRADGRTLTDEEVNSIHKSVLNKLKAKGAEIR